MPSLRSSLPPMTCLAAFEAAARLGSFTHAAVELNLSQAAISRQIKLLETNLGTTLFARNRHDVSLTEQGRRFAEQASPALRAIAEIATTMRARNEATLTVFAEMSLAAHWLTPRLAGFMAANPEIALNLVTSNRTMSEEPGTFDVALHYSGAASGLLSHKISDDQIFAVAAPELAKKPLSDLPLLHLVQPGRGWMDWASFCIKTGQPPPTTSRLTFNTYSSLLDAAMAGAGVALGWGLMVSDALRDGRVVQVGNARTPSPHALTAHTPKTSANHQPTKVFLRWLNRQADQTARG